MWSARSPLTWCVASGERWQQRLQQAPDLHIQLLGIVSIGAFVFITSLIVWKLLDLTLGLRVSPAVERLGQDAGELGIEAYPEFVLMPDDTDDEQ